MVIAKKITLKQCFFFIYITCEFYIRQPSVLGFIKTNEIHQLSKITIVIFKVLEVGTHFTL